MVTIIIPEWLVWGAVGWAIVSAILQFLNLYYRVQIKLLEDRNDRMIKELKDRLEYDQL